MNGRTEDEALELGHACAMAAVKAERERVASLPPGERLYWWFGFLTAALGAALASLGDPAARALRAALADSQEPPPSARGKGAEPGLALVKRGTFLREESPPTKKKKA